MKITEPRDYNDKESLKTAMIDSFRHPCSSNNDSLLDDLRTLLALNDLAKYHKGIEIF